MASSLLNRMVKGLKDFNDGNAPELDHAAYLFDKHLHRTALYIFLFVFHAALSDGNEHGSVSIVCGGGLAGWRLTDSFVIFSSSDSA
jgi:hypothetical protein